MAWLISSRENEVAVSQMLGGLMKTCADLGHQFPTARYLMSDKAQAFFNAWIHTTGQDTQHLLCVWHVHKAWRGKLAMINVSVWLFESGESTSRVAYPTKMQCTVYRLTSAVVWLSLKIN